MKFRVHVDPIKPTSLGILIRARVWADLCVFLALEAGFRVICWVFETQVSGFSGRHKMNLSTANFQP